MTTNLPKEKMMMNDRVSARHVELVVDDQNKVWLNVDGQCVARIGLAQNVRIEVAGSIMVEDLASRTILERQA